MKNCRGNFFIHFCIFVAVVAGITAIIMWLWNAIIPEVVGWTAITYWQALGLIVLCRLLLGGIGHIGHVMGGRGKHGSGHYPPRHLHEKLRGMSRDERREYVRNRMDSFFDRENWHEQGNESSNEEKMD